jgi:uncharacterized protein YbjT (DUF2867 family)
MRVALIGATGLVGRRLVPRLGGHELLILSRRPGDWSQANVREMVAPANRWPSLLAQERVDAAISTLGTTWRNAGSWAAFEAVDRTAVVAFARAARAAGATQMISVSSVGADAGSSNGYLALKGRAEDDLRRIGFDRLDILRPGLLRGPRGNDRRLKERLGIAISPLANLFLRGPLDRFAAIDADQVAAAIARALGAPGGGVFTHYNREIRSLARG